jgi:pyrimidine operon attenuation protein/uracil phosphoribosyltransferase
MIMTHPELDAETLYAQLESQVKSTLTGTSRLAVVGIYSGGAWLADRLAKSLDVVDVGYIDVSFYRDDYAEKGLHAEVKPSHLPFEVEGATILLVDDVLYTGRTTRAAINTLFDYGRPAKVMLAALLDRGGRQLPVAADFVAKKITLEENQLLILQKAEDGHLTLTVVHA